MARERPELAPTEEKCDPFSAIAIEAPLLFSHVCYASDVPVGQRQRFSFVESLVRIVHPDLQLFAFRQTVFHRILLNLLVAF